MVYRKRLRVGLCKWALRGLQHVNSCDVVEEGYVKWVGICNIRCGCECSMIHPVN